MRVEGYLQMTEALIACAIFLQSIEMIMACRRGLIQKTLPLEVLVKILSQHSMVSCRCWRWIFSDQVFIALQGCRIGALVFFFFPSELGLAAQMSWVLTALTSFRFLGAYNGGSDAMTLVCLFGLSLSALKPEWGLLWIAVQAILSYFLSGLRKASHRAWWSGEALSSFLKSSSVNVPQFRNACLQNPRVLFLLSNGVILSQILVPGLVMSRMMVNWVLVSGLAFHFGNFLTFGLNRFFWIWIASYPAVVFFSQWMKGEG